MATMMEKQMRTWIDSNIVMSLDQLSERDANIWHALAEENTLEFFRLAEYGFRKCRLLMQQPPPASRKEILAFLTEFRVKVMIVRNGFRCLPPVMLFDCGDMRFYKSEAFAQTRMLYCNDGGRV